MKKWLVISFAAHALFVGACILLSLSLYQTSMGTGFVEIGVVSTPSGEGSRKASRRQMLQPGSDTTFAESRAAALGSTQSGPRLFETLSGGRGDAVLSTIRSKIDRAKFYPLVARERGLEGSPQVQFQIDEHGSATNLQLTEPCGTELLDQAALETIRRAAPFPEYAEPIIIRVRFLTAND